MRKLVHAYIDGSRALPDGHPIHFDLDARRYER
jgi:hypothetical protein